MVFSIRMCFRTNKINCTVAYENAHDHGRYTLPTRMQCKRIEVVLLVLLEIEI